MGYLNQGIWVKSDSFPTNQDGSFKRLPSKINHSIEESSSDFPPANGRYALIVSLACPWAHRTTMVRALKGLESCLKVYFVQPLMGEYGWAFYPQATHKPKICRHMRHLHQLYQHSESSYSGRVTVPVLLDLTTGRIVNNESSSIIRLLNQNFNNWAEHPELNLYRDKDRPNINTWNEFIYTTINNGVYQCGFATTQEAYEQASGRLFAALEKVNLHLLDHDFLVGEHLTEADIRLFTTLIRFEAVYAHHFKCNQTPLRDFLGLYAHTKRIYHWPGIAETVDFDHIKTHYYRSHPQINPTGIVPTGPELSHFKKP